MKTFVAMFTILALVLAEDNWRPKTPRERKQISKDCLAEHPLPPEILSKINKVNYPNEEPVRKYVLCVVLHLDIFCTKAGYHADRVAKQFKMNIEESKMLIAANKCIDNNEKETPTDEWAYRGFVCFLASITKIIAG